jgi:hypothetical protein
LNKDVCGGMADPPIRNRFSCLAGGSLPDFFRFRLFRVSLLLLFKVMLLVSMVSVVLRRSCCLAVAVVPGPSRSLSPQQFRTRARDALKEINELLSSIYKPPQKTNKKFRFKRKWQK